MIRNSTILPQLRTHTAALHKALEMKLGGKLLRPDLTPAAYCDLLRAFHAAYTTLESTAGHTPLVAGMLRERSKLSWLEKDIAFLQHTTAGNGIDLYATCLPETNSSARAMGMMYVMEGATLGGKQIVGFLLRFDWIELRSCVNFFNSYGSERGRMWREFTAALEKYADNNPSETDHILAGAHEAFHHIDEVITQVGCVVKPDNSI